MTRRAIRLLCVLLCLAGCGDAPRADETPAPPPQPPPPTVSVENPGRVAHVLVALCDNEYQGIVPVPARIGNGDDPASNLYWGAAFGVKHYFKVSKAWRVIAEIPAPSPGILERVVFKRTNAEVYLVADAYRGREIRQCTVDFLDFAAGRRAVPVTAGAVALAAGSGADLIGYVGHDGLMDFEIEDPPARADERRRDAVILACASKAYFAGPLGRAGAHPLLWTTGLMAPEAYVLEAAIDGWAAKEGGDAVRARAAAAYARYQRCGIKAATRLFATGW